MSRALYRKYRSKSLEEIVGQDHITSLLRRAIDSGRISHAYLLTGPRGVGKTSIARILAHRINDLPYTEDSSHLDIIEIDAASNNGVEDVRDLREKAQLAPVSAAKKVYIIDEVHMLSKPAFNALLKTLEEPPEHIVFILATTDVEKLPATIVSRTQRFSFRAITPEDAAAHLRTIADAEGITIDDDALMLIAQRGGGSFRDSISLLDQLASIADDKEGITVALINETLGLAPRDIVTTLLECAQSGDLDTLSRELTRARHLGVSATTLTEQLVYELRQHIANKPELLGLLDSLLDVPRSSHPELKLLTVLGSFAAPTPSQKKADHPKTAALAAPTLEVRATVEELKKTPRRAPKPSSDAPAPAAPKKTPAKAGSKPFSWDELISYVQEHHVALFSVLSKCQHELTDDTLTLYTGNAFYKKKIDDPKYSAHLYESLQALDSFQPTIHTVPTPPPIKDSQAASIADMMGGGVAVSVDPLQ